MNFTPLDDTHPVAVSVNKERLITTRGRELLDRHGLHDWTFCIDRAIHRLGQCRYSKKEIAFSSSYFNAPWSEIEDTILHEIAHALVGSGHGHDVVWKRKCIEIGARPERCAPADIESDAKPKFFLKCPGCNKRWYRHRIKRKLIGAKSACCGQPLQAFRIKGR